MDITFYHFTSAASLAAVRSSGQITAKPLAIPGGRFSRKEVVSLTTNPDPSPMVYKSLWNGTPLFGSTYSAWVNSVIAEGQVPPSTPPDGPHTSEVRIEFAIPQRHPKLFRCQLKFMKKLGFAPRLS